MKIEYFLESTLLDLLQTKSIDSIHVKDIIKELGICKGTFYKYYQDKYDLVVHAFENKFYREFADAKTWEEFVSGSFRAFRRAPETVYNAFLSHDINSIGQYHRERIKKLLIEERQQRGLPCSGIEYECAFNIVTWLVDQMTITWLKGGCVETEEEAVRMIKRLMPVNLCDMV